MKYIIAIGNVMRSDDGIGAHIVQYILHNQLEQGFITLDFATNAWGILPLLNSNTEKLLIIDCAKMGKTSASYQFFSLDSVAYRDKHTVESHESSIVELVKLAQQCGYHIPCISIMGIEPACVTFGLSLSAIIEARLAEYADQAIDFILCNRGSYCL